MYTLLIVVYLYKAVAGLSSAAGLSSVHDTLDSCEAAKEHMTKSFVDSSQIRKREIIAVCVKR